MHIFTVYVANHCNGFPSTDMGKCNINQGIGKATIGHEAGKPAVGCQNVVLIRPGLRPGP